MPATAIYVRVSSRTQDTASQEPDLRRWAKAQKDLDVRWYRDKSSGSSMDRPGFRRLVADAHLAWIPTELFRANDLRSVVAVFPGSTPSRP